MLQDARASASDPAVICSFDYEAIDKPTRAIIHQAARFLYVKRGRGKLVIDGEEYVLQPNTLVAITPWKITDTVEVTETLQFIKVIYDYSYLNSVFKSVALSALRISIKSASSAIFAIRTSSALAE